MKGQTKYKMKLSGSSLIEVIVSLAIAAMTFVFLGMIFLKLSGESASRSLTEKRMVSRNILMQTTLDQSFYDDEFEKDGRKYSKEIKALTNGRGLYLVEVSSFGLDGELKLKRSRIIQKDEY